MAATDAQSGTSPSDGNHGQRAADRPAAQMLGGEDRFELLAQLDSGPGGTTFAARRLATGERAEVRLLADAGVVAKRIRLVAMLEHPVARRLLAHDLAAEPPFVALAATEARPLSEVIQAPVEPARSLQWVIDFADLLAACHHLGLLLGNVSPETLSIELPDRLQVDVTALALSAAATSPGGERDVADLLRVFAWLVTQQREPSPAQLADAIRASAAADGPAAQRSGEVAAALSELYGAAVSRDAEPPLTAAALLPQLRQAAANWAGEDFQPAATVQVDFQQLGRFRLLAKLGEGGMGAVHMAQDTADGSIVAIKILEPEKQHTLEAVARFRREARVLAEVNNPFVAQLYEINEDRGKHYIVMEYVEGTDLQRLMQSGPPLPEAWALRIMADVTRALSAAHQRGIVHRDIKPGNILLAGVVPDNLPQLIAQGDPAALRVKLVDFGLARRMTNTESMQVTRTDAFVGTPGYMAPEQVLGQHEVDARSDVYAMGVTLFEMLAGRLPFESDDAMSLIFRHSYEQPMSLQEVNPRISDGAARIVEKCLAKQPAARYEDAGRLRDALLRQLRGEPTRMQAHPLLPAHDAEKLFTVDWHWDLAAAPEGLWPLISNTERVNRAAGVPSVEYQTQVDPQRGVRRFGEFRLAGQAIAWEEHPYEWIEGRRMAIFREFSKGPFRWFLSVVELQPRPGGGTRLRHSVKIDPRGLLGRLVAWLEVQVKGFRALDRTYRRIDAAVSGQLSGGVGLDPFEVPAPLAGARRRRLQLRVERLVQQGVDAGLAEQLGEFLAAAAPQEIGRIRPVPLARQWGYDETELVEACLRAVHQGLLLLHWDILCPSCRNASEIKDTLKAVRRHAHCEACHLDFDVDFANSVEMVFQAHPEIRAADIGKYCIGGPEHYPHVVAQLRSQPGELVELELKLAPGRYALRGPQLPHAVPFEVQAERGVTKWEVELSAQRAAELPALRAGAQVLGIVNRSPLELLVRLERVAARDDAVTAAQAASLAVFRDLFPGEVLSEDQLTTVANLTFLFVRFADPQQLFRDKTDGEAFALIRDTTRQIDQVVRQHAGAVVGEEREGVFASFHDTGDAVRAAFELCRVFAAAAASSLLPLRYAVHRGTALVVTQANRLDYFGAAVAAVTQLARLAGDNQLVLSQDVAADPLVADLLRQRGSTCEVVPAGDGQLALRVR